MRFALIALILLSTLTTIGTNASLAAKPSSGAQAAFMSNCKAGCLAKVPQGLERVCSESCKCTFDKLQTKPIDPNLTRDQYMSYIKTVSLNCTKTVMSKYLPAASH